MSSKTTKGLFLRSIEGVLMQVINFVLQMVLARILIPEDFGIVAILNTFVSLANTFVNNGLSSALLQRKNITQADICTVFYIDFGISALMYALIFIAAPWIARFYENPDITLYLRVFSTTIVVGSLGSIQLTISRHKLDFSSSLASSVAATAVHAAVGIGMALNGFGVWSLVTSQVAASAVRSLCLIIMVRWIPSLQFSISSFKRMFSYSWKLFVGWLIGTLYQDIFSWIIGKTYDSHTLGCYSKGHSIPAIVNKVVTQVTGAVMFPAIAKNQDNITAVKQQTQQMLAVTAALVFPVMAGLAGTAKSLITVVLTEKWLDCVPVIQIMCIPLALNVLSNANMQTFNAIGRSDLFLKMEIIKRGSTIIMVLVSAYFNYYLMLLSIALGGVISIIMNVFYSKKYLDYSPSQYLRDILPYLLLSLGLFAVVLCINWLPCNVFLRLLLQLTICAVVYLTFLFASALSAFKSIRSALLAMFKRKR